MCLFAYPNYNEKSKAYKKGITHFECGACPECLQKKSRQWALRCSMEAKVNVGMMVTLTYDTYKYNCRGEIIGENLNAEMELSKKDVQNFFKRLRAKFPDKQIKYLCTAERGKRTNRPHYHALIFGLVFDDLVPYKKSKRGNPIYRSRTLEKIWQGGKTRKGGICTVDCVNLSAKTARYCTKYCSKDAGIDDTFMLFSRGIGESELLRLFNGKNYWIDGREYSVPRKIWEKYIEKKYSIERYSSYVAPPEEVTKTLPDIFRNQLTLAARFRARKERNDSIKRWERQRSRRELYQFYRDNDILYKRYIVYWQRKNEVYERYRPSVSTRILALPDKKYRSYKVKAIECYRKRRNFEPYIPPRSRSYAQFKRAIMERNPICRVRSRHYTANDSFFKKPHVVPGKTGKTVVTFRPVINIKSPF